MVLPKAGLPLLSSCHGSRCYLVAIASWKRHLTDSPTLSEGLYKRNQPLFMNRSWEHGTIEYSTMFPGPGTRIWYHFPMKSESGGMGGKKNRNVKMEN